MKFIKYIIISLFCLSHSEKLLIPMDLSQTDHLKAYGITFWNLEKGQNVDWLLNYRGGSFMMDSNPSIQSECLARGVKFELINAPENISAAIMRLQVFDDRFLYIVKYLDKDISNYLAESQEAMNSYLKAIEVNPKPSTIYALITRFLRDSDPSRFNKLKSCNLCLITSPKDKLVKEVNEALEAGVRMIQYRNKEVSDLLKFQEAQEIGYRVGNELLKKAGPNFIKQGN